MAIKKKVTKKKLIKKTTKKKKNVIVKENTTTPTLPTTNYYIKSWGYYNKNKNIIIEQITPNQFLYNIDGKKGIAEVQFVAEKQRGLIIEGMMFLFLKNKISPAFQFYNTPSLHLVEKYLNGNYKPRKKKKV